MKRETKIEKNTVRLVSAKTLAAALGGEVSTRTVCHLAKLGKIPAYRIGGRWLFNVEEILTTIKK